MLLTFDEYPHPQLRYTIRLEYIHPFYSDLRYDFVYLPDWDFTWGEEFILQKTGEIEAEIFSDEYIDENCEKGIENLSITICENLFSNNDILSDNICKYLNNLSTYKESKLESKQLEAERLQEDLEFQYLTQLKNEYSAEDVARAMLKVTRNPKYKYAKRILAVWGVVLQENYIEYQLRNIINRNNINDQLGKLLKENTDENLRRIKIKLRYLNEDWNLQHEKDAHKMAILVYRFICDCHLISRHNASLANMMEIIYSYLNLPKSTYNKDTQLTEPTPKEYEVFNNGENLSAPTKRKCKIYRNISAKWADFKKSRLQ